MKCLLPFLSMIIISLITFSCNDDNFPSTSTIITGKAFTEDGTPVDSMIIYFTGTKGSLSKINYTFFITDKLNEKGEYSINQLVPDDTSLLSFYIGWESQFSKELFTTHYIFVRINNGDFFKFENPIELAKKIILGQENTLDFKFVKK